VVAEATVNAVEPQVVKARPAAATAPQAPAPELAGVAAASAAGERAAAPAQRSKAPEHELDEAVDMALRESPTAAPRKPAAPGALRASEDTAPRAAAPSLARAAAPARPAAPRRSEDLPVARPDTPESDGLFESIPDSPFDTELGRVPSLDEASAASDSARDQGPDEFVTDPMQRLKGAPTQAPAAAAPAPAPKPRPAPVAATRSPALEVPAQRAVKAQSSPAPGLRVPVRVTRAQLEQGAALEITLCIEIADD
jgi:hypothetical protein